MNIKVRLKNPVFLFQLVLSFLAPITLYAGITYSDITSWLMLGELIWNALLNPYVVATIIISVWNAVNDPTTQGITDSELAMGYNKPSPKTKIYKGE